MKLDHAELLTAPARAWLERLSSCRWAGDVYLAGSAALALYLGHRRVGDLDVMCPTNRLTGQDRRDLLAELLDLGAQLDDPPQVETARDGYLYARAESGTALRFFYYPYPQVEPEEDIAGFPVVSAVDLGLMKIAAIISRGTRRDFVDLYLLTRRLPLATVLERSPDKFGHVRDFPLQALKALSDFSLVDGEPMPRLEQPLDWAVVERAVAAETRRLGRAAVGLDSAPAADEEAT